MAVLTPAPKMQFFDINGDPLVGGKVYTYEAGTTTPLTTYTDNTGSSANPNPVILNARGEASIWLGAGIYKFRLTDANDVELWTVDYIAAPISGVSPALSGNVVIDTNSSNPALKITQTGFGLALRVQDEADPDSTPTVIDNAGQLGVGTASPSQKVDISGGNLAFTSTAGTLYATVTPGASLTDVAANGARALTLSTNGSERIHITDAGLVGIGKTPSAGVELDVVGEIVTSTSLTATTSVITDTISERTAAAGVTIDGVLCKDSQVAAANRVITAATAQASTSGTSIDFTNLPAWVKRITVMFNGVSTNGASDIIVQLFASTIVTSGYNSLATDTAGAASATTTSSAGFLVALPGAASELNSGSAIISNVTGNTWVYQACTSASGANRGATGSGNVALGASLTGVRVTTVSGADTFDAGSINILYE
jgi:hypothetical protein